MRAIFIVGSAHSGTTLLFRILARHPDVFAIPSAPGTGVETKFWQFQPIVRARFGSLQELEAQRSFARFCLATVRLGVQAAWSGDAENEPDQDVDDLMPCLGAQMSYGAIFGAAAEMYAKRSGSTCWLEKTPSHIFAIDAIRRDLPEARFVQMVRDPRDVIASIKTRRATVWNTERYPAELRLTKHLEKAYDPLWDALSWRASWNAGRAAELGVPGSVHLVRYEHLVTIAQETVRRICDFLGLAYSEDLLEVPVANPAEFTREIRGISSDSVGRYRTILSDGEIAVCQWAAASAMSAADYSRLRIGISGTALSITLLLRSVVEFVLRMYRHARLHQQRKEVGLLGAARFIISKYACQARSLFSHASLTGTIESPTSESHAYSE